jgi:CBS domain-containing protein
MLTVGDIMTADPITISPHATLRDAVELIATYGVSGLPVVDGRRLVGTLSAGDIIDFAASTATVPTERESEGLDDEAPSGGDDGDSGFFVELWEDAGADVVERIRCADSPEWDYLSQYLVSDAMSREVTTFAKSEAVDQAAAYMRETGAHSAVIAEGGVLAGIITTMDITRAVADHRTDR